MSSGLEEIILERKKAFYIQNLIENHDIGRKLAEKVLGIIPNFFVLNDIKKSFIDGRNGVLLMLLEYNSELGSFQNMIAYKEFSSDNDAQYNILLHNWVKKRIDVNPKVRLPEIYATGKNYIIYEGVKGNTFNKNGANPIKQARVAGEILATYHSAEVYPANITRYSKLLNESVKNLPISLERKDRLLSLGYTLLLNYDHSKSGVYAYGDFHPENVIISPDESYGYLIDPEFIEMERNADRYEDIANFFVFSAINEFKDKKSIETTTQIIQSFLQSYNSYLTAFGQSLEVIYGHKEQIVELFFHLGLIALIKGFFTSKVIITENKAISDAELMEIMNIYEFVAVLWKHGLQYVTPTAFPASFVNNRIDNDNRILSWIGLGRLLLRHFQNDYYFHVIFSGSEKAPQTVNNILEIKKIGSKKELEDVIKEINNWFKKKIVEIKKDNIVVNDEFIANINFSSPLLEQEDSIKKLLNIFALKPEIGVLVEIIKNKQVESKEIEKKFHSGHKEIDELIKRLASQNLIQKWDRTIAYNPHWTSIMDGDTKTIILALLS
ncbi:MAG: hypothetical protein ACFFD1_01255 [Candidatus Thorarchaeota archaeon]